MAVDKEWHYPGGPERLGSRVMQGETAMPEGNIFPVAKDHEARAWVNAAKYGAMYTQSLADSEGFWSQHGRRVDWIKPFTQVKDVSFDAADLHIRWFHDGTLNVSANCIDRHLAARGDRVAIIWEGDSPNEDRKITYRELHEQVCRLANAMLKRVEGSIRYIDKSNEEELLRAADAVLELAEKLYRVTLLLGVARVMLALKRPQKAFRAANLATEKEPQNVKAWEVVADAAVAEGIWALATRAAEKWQALDPTAMRPKELIKQARAR